MQIAVLAGNLQQFKTFIQTLPPELHKHYFYIFEERNLCGRYIDGFLLYGTWYNRPEKNKIIDMACAIIRRVPK